MPVPYESYRKFLSMNSWEIQKKHKKIMKNELCLYNFKKQADFSAVLVYPNTYFVGMSNLGFQAIYQQINLHPDFICERAFLPEGEEELFYKNGPKKLSSLENYRRLSEFNIIAFSISYEIDYINMLKVLYYAGIPLESSERDASYPLIIAGGAAATLNPQPIADFADLFIIGEAENLINKLLDVFPHFDNKENLLKHLNTVESFYAPKYFEKNRKIKRNFAEKLDFNTNSVFLTNDTEFKNTFLIELTRGCPYECSFCVVGNCFDPYRVCNIEKIKEQINFAKKFTHKIGLISSSISNYPYLPQLAEEIENNKIKVSFSSMRADKIDENILKILLNSDQKTLTFAPETASAKLKKIINKDITEQNIYKSLDMCLKSGIKSYKFYFMLGLPHETEEDVLEIATLVKNISGYIHKKNNMAKIKLSISKFIPKPFTPLQWEKFEEDKVYSDKIKLLKSNISTIKNMHINFESEKNALISEILSRGDIDICPAFKENFLQFNYKNFIAMAENSLFDIKYKADFEEILPWEFLQESKLKEKLWKIKEDLLKP